MLAPGSTPDDGASNRRLTAALACGQNNCPCATTARSGAGLTHCPSHDDEHPSLSVRKGRVRPSVKCFGPCTHETVMSILRQRGLWDDHSSARYRAMQTGDWH